MNKITKTLFSFLIATTFNNAQAMWQEGGSMEAKPVTVHFRNRLNADCSLQTNTAYFIDCRDGCQGPGRQWQISEGSVGVDGIPDASKVLTLPYRTNNSMGMFRFESTEEEGCYKIRNLGTGKILSDDPALYPKVTMNGQNVLRHAEAAAFFVHDSGGMGNVFKIYSITRGVDPLYILFQSKRNQYSFYNDSSYNGFYFIKCNPYNLSMAPVCFTLNLVPPAELRVARLEMARARTDARAVRIIQENEALRATVVAQADKMEILLQMVLDLQTEVRARPDEGDDAATVEGSGFTAGAKVRQWAQNVLAGIPVKDAPPLDKVLGMAASISDSEASRFEGDRDVDAELDRLQLGPAANARAEMVVLPPPPIVPARDENTTPVNPDE